MHPASSTSRPLPPWIASAAKALLLLLLSGWLLLALGWALLHGAIVPRIDEWRPQLQALARQATGLQVEIGRISARSTGLVPSFELQQVRLLDAAGRPALVLPQVLLALSPQATLRLELEQLLIRGAELDVRRSADGRLWLAGVPLSPGGGDAALGDWLLSQPEWALQGGTLRWHDEVEGVDLVLTEVDAVMRNPGNRHDFRLDATPPPAWGERLSLRGQLRQPLLSRSASRWQDWSGQLYAQFSRIDLAPLQAYARLAGLGLTQGQGALRAWVDIAKGRISSATADLNLTQAQAQLAPQLAPLALSRLSGRLSWKSVGHGMDLQTEGLSLDTADGLHWPGGKLALQLELDAQGQATRGQFKADRLDLQALASMAQRLPLPEPWHAQLRSLAPQGVVQPFEASWQGPLSEPRQLSARGKVQDLVLAAEGQRPGASGLQLEFKLQREAGVDKAQASVQLRRGWLEFPALFQEPRIALEQFSAELRLRHDARGLEIDLNRGTLQSPDAQGQFHASWKRAAQDDSLGHLDLQGQLQRAEAQRVWRYLPLSMAEPVRDYVRAAVQQGQLSQVRFKLKGPLASFPFERPQDGEFQISGRLRGGAYAYVPPRLQEPGSKPWPSLTQMDAELLFQRDSLQILKAQARVAEHAGLQVSRAEARIAHLGRQSVVEVTGQIKGPLAQALSLIHQSPIAGLTRRALERTSASGEGELQLKLNLPLHELARSKVQGNLALAGNDVQISPEAPPLTRLRGQLAFSENGFQVQGQGRMLGGEVRLEGGLRGGPAGEGELVFRGQGTASVEALQQWRELADLAPLLQHASGSAAYSAVVGFRQGALEMQLDSDLAGVALALPAPLGKDAAATLPLRIDKTVLRESQAPGRRLQDRLSLQLGAGTPQGLSASYLRDIAGSQAQVLSGQLQLGPRTEAPADERGVRALVELPRLDLDAWKELLAAGLSEDGRADAGRGYLPTALSLRTPWLKVQGHEFREVVLGGRRDGNTWRVTVSASELSGYGEYRLPAGGTPGRVYARLSRLSLGAAAAHEVEALLESQPSSIPALDIVIDELELRGKKLGRLEVEAVNLNPAGRETQREWRLSKLNLRVPEAVLSATGSWAALPSAAGSAPRRGTQLSFKLEVADSGELLTRMGLDGAIRRGRGRLEGQLAWSGSPLALHTPSLSGQLVVDMQEGQFLKADPGAGKLLGVLSLQALPRRLTLDFRDVFSEGFAFDSVRGNVSVAQGVASTRDLRMKGVSAVVLMEGSADIASETQDLRVWVLPEINAGTASLLAATVNPAMALGTFLAQWLLRQPLNQAGTQEFHINGSWSDPQIQKVARQRPPAEGRSLEGKP